MIQQKEIRFFEFLIALHILLCLLRDMYPQSLKQVPLLASMDDNYLLSEASFFLLTILMIKQNGTRLTLIFIIIAKLAFIIQRYYLFQIKYLNYFNTLCILFLLFAYYLYPTYEFPSVQGRHRVGFKEIKIQVEKITNASVFYPTNDQLERKNVRWAPERYIRDLYKILKNFYGKNRLPGYIPYDFFKIILHFITLRNMDVQYNAPIIKSGQFPVVIFSHGLASHSNYSSCILRDLASKGFIVFSPYQIDTNEGYIVNTFEEFVESHKDNLKNRQKIIKKIYEIINDKKKIKEIFGDIVIDLERIVMIGHSFGGATHLMNYYLYKDLRIFCMILLDPAMEFMNHEEGLNLAKKNPINFPVLILNSQYFEYQYKEMKQIQNLKIFGKINNQNKNFYNIIIPKTGHDDFGDLCYLLPVEMAFNKIIGPKSKLTENKQIINQLIEIFYTKCIDKKDYNIINNFKQLCNIEIII